jgi:hypothetical protein
MLLTCEGVEQKPISGHDAKAPNSSGSTSTTLPGAALTCDASHAWYTIAHESGCFKDMIARDVYERGVWG